MIRTAGIAAVSLNGKIASGKAHEAYFGSKEDLSHLMKIRSGFDGVLCGGETFRIWPYPRVPETISQKKYFNIVLSHSLDLEFSAAVLSDKNVSWLVITDNKSVPKPFPVDVIRIDNITATTILNELEKRGLTSLLIEGGGEVFRLFLNEDRIDEFHLTFCPKIVEGNNAVSLIQEGLENAKIDKYFSLESHRAAGDEVFLHYKRRGNNHE